jgi:hypothetical protein
MVQVGWTVLTIAAAISQPASKPPAEGETPLRVVIDVIREAPGKRPSTESVELRVVTGRTAHLKAKTETPIAVEGSFQYRAIGTDVECRASTSGAGRYLLEVKLLHDVMYRLPAATDAPVRPGALHTAMPFFRTIEATVSGIFTDGQASESVVARDPVSGEQDRVRVTVTRARP